MNQLGRLDFEVLDNYVFRSQDFKLLQDYFFNKVKEIVGASRTPGVLYGGLITPVAGLTVKVSAGGALFSNGEIVTWADQNLVLYAADGANPRIDRIELVYALNNNTQVMNANQPPTAVTLDQIHVATAVDNKGDASGAPVIKAKTVGNISLGSIHVAANQVTTLVGDISQIEGTEFESSAIQFADATSKLRFNRTSGAVEITNNGVNWYPVQLVGTETDTTVAIDPATQSPYILSTTPFTGDKNKLFLVNTANGPMQFNLPVGVKDFEFGILDVAGNADINPITIHRHAAEKIGGLSADYVCEAPNGRWFPLCDGTDYELR